MKKTQKIFVCMLLICIIFFAFNSIFAASDPTIVNKLNSALKKIQSYLVRLSMPAAGVAIAVGVLMRKLAFGDEDKMVKGKKVIINAIIGYGIILSIDLIIKFIEAILK